MFASIRPLLVALLVLLVILGIVMFLVPQTSPSQPQACTMDAKLCPDGSYVGRTGPDCEFALCPAEASGEGGACPETGDAPVVGAGQHCGRFVENAPVCATGYHCQIFTSRPDTGGTCVADSAGGGILPYNSGVRGTVLTSPTCPVEQDPPQPQCAAQPYATTVAVFRANNPVIPLAATRSGVDGSFQISLPPGRYTLGAGESMLPRCEHPSVTVGATGYTVVNISCATGIR